MRGDVEATIASAERLARDAVAVGAPWVLTTFQVGLDDKIARTVTRCAAILAEAGTGLAIEFSPLGPVAGIEVLAATGVRRGGIVIDCWNFCFGPSTWEDLAKVPLEQVAYVQFTDALAPLGEANAEEAMTRRALPGAGVLPLDRFTTALRDRGWDGVVSLQVLSDELRMLPVAEYARRVHDAAAPYWR